jgi:hypothetical protein
VPSLVADRRVTEQLEVGVFKAAVDETEAIVNAGENGKRRRKRAAARAGTPE